MAIRITSLISAMARKKKGIEKNRVFPANLDKLLEDIFFIEGIPVGIVDPHHYVLPLWFYYFRENPAQLFHVDAHSDMNDINSLKKKVVPPTSLEELITYTQTNLDEGNFICPAVWLGMLKSIYHFDPRDENVDVYQESMGKKLEIDLVKSGKKVPSESISDKLFCSKVPDLYVLATYQTYQGLHWKGINRSRRSDLNFPTHGERTKEEAGQRINADPAPLLLDIDLDAFECCYCPDEKKVSEWVYQSRVEETFQQLKKIKKPSLITIARSQTPRYVPQERVNEILKDVLERLHEVYV